MGGVARPLARSGWRRCSGAGMASVEDEVRRADPLSVNPGQRVRGERMRRYAPQGGAAVDVEQECFSVGASATHQRRLLCPRRCRGLTESVTARAVGSGWWGSSASPKRCVVCGVCSPMRPPLRSVRMGFLKNSASPMRGRTLALLREVPSGCGQAAAYLVARGGLIRNMWSVARVNDVYSHR